MKTDFLGQAYESRSPIMSSQTAINIYPETTEGANDSVAGFIGTPGLTSVYTGSGEVRGLHVAGAKLYAVIGNTVYRMTTAYAATNLGTLPSSNGRVSITDNGSQVIFAHDSGWHYVAFDGVAIAPVIGAPLGSVTTYQDNYGIFTLNNGQLWGITGLADLSSISALDVASAEAQPDDLISVISDHRELWLFGEETTEIWVNTGAATFPYERAPGGFIEHGCAAKWSPAKIDNSVFWIGRDINGKGQVFRANAYVPERISTHGIEYAINQYSTIEDAFGFCYQEEGHSFYWLTFPSANSSTGECWIYDCATKMWHQRAAIDPDTGNLIRHRANCHVVFNGKQLIGDFSNGKIYEMSLNTYTDDGSVIYRERAWELPENEFKRIRVNRLELIATTGDGESNSAPIVWFQLSKDAGRTWGYQKFATLGNIGQTTARAIWRRGGMGRNLVARIGTTMANRVHWTAVNLQADALEQ